MNFQIRNQFRFSRIDSIYKLNNKPGLKDNRNKSTIDNYHITIIKKIIFI
ncbi:unnamed protein product [marine sediment metagenome]|uniref:Uncharacterized protein n=1 Tax=marine sediment metagenome TaxID=412755 RepID=X1NN44_9ZZZZ